MDSSKSPRSRRGAGASGRATIYDIAELAGVNPSTVSRALNQPGRVSAKMEQRVRDAAEQLNFHANPMARALPTGRTGTIALVVADITNPVVFGIVRGAEHAAAKAGYTLLISESQESSERERQAISRIAPGVDGVVLATTRLPDDEIIAVARDTAVVTINRAAEGIQCVEPDVRPGVRALIDHLVQYGHRTVAFVSGPESSWTSKRRWDALVECARDRHMSIFEIGPNEPTIDGGRHALSRVELSGATAAVAFNDLMAIGLIQQAAQEGLDVPARLSVSGFDDIFGATFITPAITTVRADLAAAGERAVNMVLDQIGVADMPTGLPALETELIARESTAAAQHAEV